MAVNCLADEISETYEFDAEEFEQILRDVVSQGRNLETPHFAFALSRLGYDQSKAREEFRRVKQAVSPRIRAVVEKARDLQDRRYQGTQIPFNAAMPGGHVADYCQFSNEGLIHFKSVISECGLSTRSMDRLAKVARTIADLANQDAVEPSHVQEARQFVVGGVLRSGG